MIKKYLSLVVLMMVFSSTVFGSLMLNQAEQFYKDKKYDKALITYQHLLESSPKSVSLLYNIGNTYFKLNKVGYSIGYYRRALKWEPLNKDIRYNLTLARKGVVDSASVPNSIYQKVMGWVALISLNMSYYILMLSLFFVLLVFWCLQKKKFSREILMNVAVVSVVTCAMAFVLFFLTMNRYSQDYVVVIEKKASVYSGPSDVMALLFYVHEGHECKIVNTSGRWSEIELLNGFKGWIPTESLFSI